jgi:hypothetical protein
MQVNELDLNTGALDPDVRSIRTFRVDIPFQKENVNRLEPALLG